MLVELDNVEVTKQLILSVTMLVQLDTVKQKEVMNNEHYYQQFLT